jgi:transcriptional regulator with XRE-family HTH domain
MPDTKAPKKRKQPKKLNQPLAMLLRALMKKRGFKAKHVAKAKFGITPEAFSYILQARTRPKKDTFEKILNELCTTTAEKMLLRRAYEDPRAPEFSFELQETNTKHNEYALSKIKMAMRARALEATFQQQIADTLDTLGIRYQRDYVSGDVIVDFLITINSLEHVDMTNEHIPEGEFIIERQIALVCELDPYADKLTLNKLAQYIWTSLCPDKALVIVPHREDTYFEFQEGRVNWALTDKNFFEHVLTPAQAQEAHIDKSGAIIRKTEIPKAPKTPPHYPIR